MNKIEEALEPFARIGRETMTGSYQRMPDDADTSRFDLEGLNAGHFREAARIVDNPKRGGDDALQLKKWGQLREVVAELVGEDPRTWPDHGNASLAIAARVALMVNREKKMREALEAAKMMIYGLLGEDPIPTATIKMIEDVLS